MPYTTAVKDDRMTATRDYFADGTLEIGTTGMATVLVTFNLTLAGGTISNGVWTLAFDASTVAAVAAGTAVEAQIKNSVGTVGRSGITVGTSGTDIILDNNSIANGQNVTISSADITHAA